MKGAYKGYFAMPNLGRLRNRVVDAPKDLSQKIREKAMRAIAEVLNENSLSIKAKIADFVVTECGLQFKDKAAEAQVAAVTGNIFDFYAGSTAEALADLTGDKGEGEGDDVDPDPDPEPKEKVKKDSDEFED